MKNIRAAGHHDPGIRQLLFQFFFEFKGDLKGDLRFSRVPASGANVSSAMARIYNNGFDLGASTTGLGMEGQTKI
jgi:hypothetical protein